MTQRIKMGVHIGLGALKKLPIKGIKLNTSSIRSGLDEMNAFRETQRIFEGTNDDTQDDIRSKPQSPTQSLHKVESKTRNGEAKLS